MSHRLTVAVTFSSSCGTMLLRSSLTSVTRSTSAAATFAVRTAASSATAATLHRTMSASSASSSSSTAFSRTHLNPAVVNAAYAVRGELVARADVLRDQLSTGGKKLPFEQVVACNIGNPHELGQTPITFFRQVLALMQYPALMESAPQAFAPDAIARAKEYKKAISGGTGAYTTSQGVRAIRQEVARFIEARDGSPADAENIFLTDGASAGVKMILNLLIRNAQDGVMTPIPQYPLYSASMTLFGGECVGYYLDESNAWGLTKKELERAFAEGKKKGLNPRALVVINPGNPTGQCLPRELMVEVVQFCEQNGLLLMADEVYQQNIYSTVPFNSFKSVVASLKSSCPLVSFHSVSKGFLGECGQRGGYFELTNIHSDMKAELVKLSSISLCSNTSGQMMVGLMVNPPAKGDASYDQYVSERDTIKASLKRRAVLVARELNSCTGITCNAVEGALYAFPSITLPESFQAAAKAAGKQPDVFYSLALLEATGICVVPGSGFGQQPGTWHFRTTILPSETAMTGVMERFKRFHEELMKKYQYNKKVNVEAWKKQLLYRSRQRGWLELDLLMGTWASENLSKLDATGLEHYERVVAAENPDLIKSFIERLPLPSELAENPIARQLVDYAQTQKKAWTATVQSGNQ